MSAHEAAIRDGLVLDYRVEGSTGPGRTREARERFTFRERPHGRYQVHLDAEDVSLGLYAAAYGDPIIVDAGLLAANGMSLQFRGLCPLLLSPSGRKGGAEVRWPWDGAGVQERPADPEQQLAARGGIEGPARWRQWNVWILRMADVPPGAPSPVAYYERATGLLVGVEYGADLPGAGRFVYCDAALDASSCDVLLSPASGNPAPVRG